MGLTNSTLGTSVNNGTDTSGATGNVTVTAPAVTVTGGALTTVSTGTRGAGNVTLNTDTLLANAGAAAGGAATEISSTSSNRRRGRATAGGICSRRVAGQQGARRRRWS